MRDLENLLYGILSFGSFGSMGIFILEVLGINAFLLTLGIKEVKISPLLAKASM
jgi:hypothetical protein